MMGKNLLLHPASRILNTPLMITEAKLNAILAVLGPRIGLEVSATDQEAIADLSVPRRYRAESDDGIALIPIYDTLVYRAAGLDAYSRLTTYEDIRGMFLDAMNDPTIATILLDVDSPGGEVSGVFDLVDDIYNSRGMKPIYAIANENALSAAYAIASAADRVLVPRTGLVGSIGVRMVHVDQSAFNEKAGLKVTTIFAGERKNDFSPHEPISEEALGVARSMVDETYDLFVKTVARNRSMDEAMVRKTEAGVFQGENAVAAGLADAVMNFSQVVESILSSQGGESMKLFGKRDKQVAEPDQPELLDVSAGSELDQATAEMDLEAIRQESMTAGLQQGREEGSKEATSRAVEIIGLCAAADPGFPMAAVAELIQEGLPVEEARIKILEMTAERSRETEIVSTVSATSTGGKNPLMADAERRAEAVRRGAR
jgi:capsid assembly protease